MRLVFISDTHGYLRERDIPDGDVLIHCGDACSSGQEFEFENFMRQMEQLRPRFRQILYTPGNHDRCVEAHPNKCRKAFDRPNTKLLIHEPFEFEGIKFFGSPYTPQFFDWSFMYPREKGKEIWCNIPDDTDVLFTHGMPYGVLDSVGRLIGSDFDEHVGCHDLLDRIVEIEPKVFAGGHLHLRGGNTMTIDGLSTVFANAAICDDSYSPVHRPIEIDI